MGAVQVVDPRTGELHTVVPKTLDELEIPDGVAGPDGQPLPKIKYPKLPPWHSVGP